MSGQDLSNQRANMPITVVKNLLAREDIKKRFEDILGKKSPQFMASLVNTVSATPALQRCEPNSIMQAAFVAAALDLPIDSNLGFAAIVPYKNGRTNTWVAQFQMMYRGFIQLAIRTGLYRGMNASDVYEDEIVHFNPITREIKFVEKFPEDSQRNRGETEKVVGYYAWFELLNGFRQGCYMTVSQVGIHAKEYSQSYKYDLAQSKRASKWSTDFEAMATKTVIKRLLSKWGILSVEMQRAIQEDQKVFIDVAGTYADNPETIDTQVADPFQQVEHKPEEKPEEEEKKEEVKETVPADDMGDPSQMTEEEKKEYGL